jgi:ER lumen protein retaining receptor
MFPFCLSPLLVRLFDPNGSCDRPTNDPSIDTFRVEYLVGPAFVLAFIFNYSYSIIEIFWSFSIFLEAVAILPQLFILQRTGEAETITTHYLAALGAYRGLYIPNWIYRCVIVLFLRVVIYASTRGV